MTKWTEHNVDRLRKLWGSGKTAREIAEILGPEFSRNSIIGRAFRMNLSAKIRTKKTNKDLKNTERPVPTVRKGKISRFRSLLISKNFEPARNLTLEELTEDTCKYMPSDVHPNDPDPRFCGRKNVVAKNKKFSYCPLHLMLIFNDPKNKKEDFVNKDEEVPQFIEKKFKSA